MAPPGLSEDIVRLISAKKREPEWLTEWRLEALRRQLDPNQCVFFFFCTIYFSIRSLIHISSHFLS